MSTSETRATAEPQASSKSEPVVTARPKKQESVLDKVLALLSSVRFGVTMLMLLLACCMIGMLIMQVNVEGFDKYYAELTPAQQLVYGKLGFFDIYHAWYFNLLLAITGLNIVLASIDRFPTAWAYYAKPKLSASPNFIRAQEFNREWQSNERPQALAERIREMWAPVLRRETLRGRVILAVLVLGTVYTYLFGYEAAGRAYGIVFVVWVVATAAWLALSNRYLNRRQIRIVEDKGRITVFGQANLWNRFGAYVVHVALLTMFIGGFLTVRYGVGGMMEIRPGRTSDRFNTFEMAFADQQIRQDVGQAQLPFQVECTDLQQKLIREEGGLGADNTIDWLSYVRIKDGGTVIDDVVHLNNPLDYRGYRFFQSQFTPIGNARQVKLRFEPVAGGEAIEVEVPRNGTAEVPGIGQVAYSNFYPDFEITEEGPTTVTGDYNNPVAQLEITTPEGRRLGAFAFNRRLADDLYGKADAQAAKDGTANQLLVNGHKVVLQEFEKVALGHTLAVQYDPGRLPFYYGSALLCVALMGVFLWSHQRVWAVVEAGESGSKVYFGGNVNRNRPAFEGRFNSLVQSVTREKE